MRSFDWNYMTPDPGNVSCSWEVHSNTPRHQDVYVIEYQMYHVTHAVLHKCYRGTCISHQESISDRVGFRTIMHVFFSKLEDNEKRMGLMVELFVRNSRESEKRLCTALHDSAPMFVMTKGLGIKF